MHSLLIQLEVRASQPQGSSCLHLFSAGIAGSCHHVQRLNIGLGVSNSGPRICASYY